MKAPARQRGFLLILAVIIIMVAAVMAAAIATLTSGGAQSGGLHVQSTQALFIAESGLERALNAFRAGTSCGALSFTSSVGQGSYTTSATLFNPTAPLNVPTPGISTTDSVIPLSGNPAGSYAPRGRIRIDSEEIYYAAISGNSFIGAKRGVAGTTPAAHAAVAVAPVYQNQCVIQSDGTVDNTRRTLVQTVNGMSVRQGSFTKVTGVAPVNQIISGVGFTPKAVIFYWTRQTAAGFNANVNAGVGFATSSTAERAASVTSLDAQGRSEEGRIRSESYAIIFLTGGGSPAPTVAARAELVSMNADGFTLNWNVNDTNAYVVHYIALGGDVSNALAGTFNLSTGGGNQGVTGILFQPDFVMFLWGHTGDVTNATTGFANAQIGLGFARSSTAQGAMVYGAQDNRGGNDRRRWQQRTDSTILLLNLPNPTGQDAIVNFASMDTDGFTVTKSNAPSASTPIFYLALRGGRHNVGSFNQPAITPVTTTGVGFQPEELVLASFNRTATNAISTTRGLSLGAAQFPTSRGSIWFQSQDSVDPSEVNMYTATTNLITLANTQTVNAQANLSSFVADGFTLAWPTTDATARQILYWAIGPNVLFSNANSSWYEVFP